MNRFYQLVLGVGLICLVLAYVWSTHYFWLTPADRKLVTEEDTAVAVQLGTKGFNSRDYQIEIAKPPENGSLIYQAGRYVYLPQQDFNGTDQFEYRIKKGNRTSATATVEIEITPKNDQPEAEDLKYMVQEDSSVVVQLAGKDPDADPLKFLLIDQPRHGEVSGEVPHIIYTPANDFNGIDSFTYKATDGNSFSQSATVTVEILPVNDAPSASGQLITAFENNALDIKLEGTDVDSQISGYRLVELPKNGALEWIGGSYRYTPQRGFIGRDRFMFVVRDELQESVPAVIEVNVKKITRDVALNRVLKNVIKDGGVAIGDYKKPEHVYHSGKYIPASVLKIVTATAALSNLGADYRFKTEFYVDEKKNLYIKGFGDPTLTSKDWHDIAKDLQAKKIFQHDLNALLVDVSAFADNLQVDGRRESIHYFDSPPSALASNYNTVAVRIQNNRRIQVVDDYTPLTSLVVKKAKWLPEGYQHFNVALDSDESIRYSSELAVEIFKEYGAVFNEKSSIGKTPNQLEPIHVFKSKSDLKTVIREMLQDSNNFVANQLLLILAYEKKGEGVDISDGAEIVTRFLKNKIGIQPDDINLVEGSGISTRNSIDLLAMLKVMNYFNEYRELLPHLRYSKFSELAKAGRKWNILAKSGTLSNISTLAGFIQTDEKEWKPFVIMLNNTGKARGTVIDIIGRYYNG